MFDLPSGTRSRLVNVLGLSLLLAMGAPASASPTEFCPEPADPEPRAGSAESEDAERPFMSNGRFFGCFTGGMIGGSFIGVATAMIGALLWEAGEGGGGNDEWDFGPLFGALIGACVGYSTGTAVCVYAWVRGVK